MTTAALLGRRGRRFDHPVLAVSARPRATSRMMFRCWDDRRKRSKASSGVIFSRSIRMPLAWPMTSSGQQGLLQMAAKASEGAAFINARAATEACRQYVPQENTTCSAGRPKAAIPIARCKTLTAHSTEPVLRLCGAAQAGAARAAAESSKSDEDGRAAHHQPPIGKVSSTMSAASEVIRDRLAEMAGLGDWRYVSGCSVGRGQRGGASSSTMSP